MYEIDVVIEIQKGGHIKYEFEKKKNMLICDRILHTPFKYSFNYGFVPNTLSEDGDPLDVVVLMDDELIPGCLIKCKILGYLDTSDDEGNDPKLIVCPIYKIDPKWKNVEDLTKVDEHTLEKIRYFFQHYKDLENKTVLVKNYHDKNDAVKIYIDSVQRYTNNIIQKTKITYFFKPLN